MHEDEQQRGNITVLETEKPNHLQRQHEEADV
jgi:hypothetical protein